MELFLALAGASLVCFVVLKIGKIDDDHGLQKPAQSSKHSLPGKTSSKVPAIQALRFDVESAKELPHSRILEGAAWVIDGDTIKIKNTQIRLFGIDAPELDHPYGMKAKWALHRMCKGHAIRAEITDIDHYGRTVARCFLSDGRDLSAEMVKQGLAIDWAKYSGGVYRQFEASDARRRLFLADARQNGRMYVWEKFEARQAEQ